jgi:mRNA interferase MazF
MVLMPEGNLTYKRGEIRWVNLDPNDIMNQYGLLTIVMPFRPGSKQAPYIVNVKATATNGLDKDRFIDVAQIRSVDYRRVLGLVGILEVESWEEIHTALDVVLGFGV